MLAKAKEVDDHLAAGGRIVATIDGDGDGVTYHLDTSGKTVRRDVFRRRLPGLVVDQERLFPDAEPVAWRRK